MNISDIIIEMVNNESQLSIENKLLLQGTLHYHLNVPYVKNEIKRLAAEIRR